ncbi:NUDIX hydrolase [Gorillibacterium timonense]|uniref:NUDIX hydrolase n=1 Tax=Gorillibacterium timonense TaxID=1689269 RepID=UPI00071C24CC|nr:NUDIX domain-containing protein [Gorillibacterium timonense]
MASDQAELRKRHRVPCAVHLFLWRGEEILLLRRFQTGYEDGNYSVVAGHLDGEEEVKAAMIREAWEEAGIVIEPDNLEVAGVMHRRSDEERIDFFLNCSSWKGEIQNKEPDKCDELRWVHKDELPPNVIPYVRKALDNTLSGKWFTSFGWNKE